MRYFAASQLLNIFFPMFERQTRQPFPATNILILALVVVAFLVYILKSVRQPAIGLPPIEVTSPVSDSGRIEVYIDSLAR